MGLFQKLGLKNSGLKIGLAPSPVSSKESIFSVTTFFRRDPKTLKPKSKYLENFPENSFFSFFDFERIGLKLELELTEKNNKDLI